MPRTADDQNPGAAGQGRKAQDTANAGSTILSPLIRDLDWDEAARLAEWLAVVDQARGEAMP